MSEPKIVLVVCATQRDLRELSRVARATNYRFISHQYASVGLAEMVAPAARHVHISPVLDEVQRLQAEASSLGVQGVVSTDDYPGSTIAAIASSHLGLPGTPIIADLVCQHKYYSRLMQQRARPDAVPAFALLHADLTAELPYPFFIKPVKSFLSVGAYRVESPAMLRVLHGRASLPDTFFRPFDDLMQRYTGMPHAPSRVLAEGLLTGCQATYEGFMLRGELTSIGVVDSIMHARTPSFERFEYPSSLPAQVQDRMAEVACSVMKAIGFEHGIFNIEFMYDSASDKLLIVEINPRMASQFCDLYEKVDGFNTYEVLLDLALGRPPTLRREAGPHGFAASCVLRSFKDALVVSCPDEQDIAEVLAAHSDARIEVLARQGEFLSQQLQDAFSYRYAIINLGAESRAHAREVLRWCRARLTFQLQQGPGPGRLQ